MPVASQQFELYSQCLTVPCTQVGPLKTVSDDCTVRRTTSRALRCQLSVPNRLTLAPTLYRAEERGFCCQPVSPFKHIQIIIVAIGHCFFIEGIVLKRLPFSLQNSGLFSMYFFGSSLYSSSTCRLFLSFISTLSNGYRLTRTQGIKPSLPF